MQRADGGEWCSEGQRKTAQKRNGDHGAVIEWDDQEKSCKSKGCLKHILSILKYGKVFVGTVRIAEYSFNYLSLIAMSPFKYVGNLKMNKKVDYISILSWKVVQQLTEKCKQMHAELEDYARHKQEHKMLVNDHSILQKEHDALRFDNIYR